MSREDSAALVPMSADLQREVETVQHLRQVLHDAYIVESHESTGRSSTTPPPATDTHRTLDAPTLALLKAPNYPFLLCEGAPPSYVPPPVPYDVEGEVEAMKAKVLQVQRELVAFRDRGRPSKRPEAATGDEVKKLPAAELVAFLDGNAAFAELSWMVSSLEWFYRWVLSHSISHLWNAKDQLEFVMTEGGQALPATVEVMDDALEQYPFTEAVSILDTDRQNVIAQERRRIRSVSRTYRDRLPPTAVTAATSCYLSSEEKYMYQEFFNQSEHLLLLLDHATLMQRSAKTAPQRETSTPLSSLPRAASSESNGGAAGDGGDAQDSNALVRRPSTGDAAAMEGMTRDAMEALAAEHEVVRTLIDTIRERRRDGIQFAVSAEEYQRSRTSQIAVYGCVVSDMNLMAQQMNVAQEFLDKYEDWIRFHGFDSHDRLMELLVEHSGGSRWPVLSLADSGACCGSGSSHFTPPTVVWKKEKNEATGAEATETLRVGARPGSSATGLPGETTRLAPNGGTPTAANARAASASVTAPPAQPTHGAGSASWGASASGASAGIVPSASPSSRPSEVLSASPVTPSVTRGDSQVPAAPSASSRSPAGAANIFCGILRCVEERMLLDAEQNASGRGGLLTGVSVSTSRAAQPSPPLSRLWMAAALRHTVLRLAHSQWTTGWLQDNLLLVEEELLRRLRQTPADDTMAPHASALCVVLREFVTLARVPSTALAGDAARPTEVRVALHSSCAAAGDLREEANYALSAVELERWGALLDALWFQADPTGAASAHLLLQSETGGAGMATASSAPAFQRLERITVPVLAPNATSAACASLFYRTATRAGTGVSLAALLDREAIGLTSSVYTSSPENSPAARCGRRYGYARDVLSALGEVEAKGLLPCFACRVSACAIVPLSSVIFLSPPPAPRGATQDLDRPAGVPPPCPLALLPPGAIQLMRLYEQTGLQRPPAEGASTAAYAPFAVYESEPLNFSSIGMQLAGVLREIATARGHPGCLVLKELYLTADTVLEQATWEVENKVLPKSFVNATTQPIPMSCAPAASRAISIQREPSAINRNSGSLRRFVSPLLRALADYLSTARMAAVAAEAGAYGNTATVTTPPASLTRRTEMLHSGNVDGLGNRTSPSPSAVRPH